MQDDLERETCVPSGCWLDPRPPNPFDVRSFVRHDDGLIDSPWYNAGSGVKCQFLPTVFNAVDKANLLTP